MKHPFVMPISSFNPSFTRLCPNASVGLTSNWARSLTIIFVGLCYSKYGRSKGKDHSDE